MPFANVEIYAFLTYLDMLNFTFGAGNILETTPSQNPGYAPDTFSLV